MPKSSNTDVFAKVLSQGSSITAYQKYTGLINAALIAQSYPNAYELKNELARRDGCLVINVHEENSGYYNLHLLMTERTVSINTTATGGNVQLMSIDDLV